MITICRAEDGQIFQVNSSIRDIEGFGSLEAFLQQETGVDADLAIAFLSDGRRLTTSNMRDLGSLQDQHIFVYNQEYLNLDIEDALRKLTIEPPFQPLIEDVTSTTPPIRPAALAASYTRTAQLHHDHIQQILRSLSLQHQALQIASSSLDYNVLQLYEAFDGFAVNARKELEKQAALLEALESDLELLSKVGVHVEFCSMAVRMAIEAGDPQRVLADYVSKQKMRQVADTCTKTHDDLQSRFNQVEQAVNNLRQGADSVRSTLANVNLFDEAKNCSRRSQDLLDKIMDASATLESPASDVEYLVRELKYLDEAHRHEVQEIVHKKNTFTRQCLTALRYIAALNNDIVHVPRALEALVTSFRGKTSFSHIQRLHNMLYAYGATIIEIVRRKEFSRFFYQRAQSILEIMAKVSVSEKKRRQVYRSEVHGQLPFDTKGMDDPVPTIDFSPSGGTDFVYSFERSDVDGLLGTLDDLEKYAKSTNNLISEKTVRECKSSLERLVGKMDNLELGFDKIAERSLLSRSHISRSRGRSTEVEEKMILELADELRFVQDAKTQQEGQFQQEKADLQTEIRFLNANVLNLDSNLSMEQEKAARMERELQQVRAQMESEAVARRILEERNAELTNDLQKQQNDIARALADATEQARQADVVRQELAQVRDEFEEVKQLEKRNAAVISNLLEEQAKNLSNLEETRSRGEDLESRIQRVREESNRLHQALKDATEEKNRLLRDQAFEHDRKLRDHIAEADGDRAVLDRQFSELQAVLEHHERQMKDLKGELEVANADATGLRQELRRVEFELQKSRQTEQLLRDDLKAGQASQHSFEQRIEDSNRLIAQILEVAINFRNTHLKALHLAQSITSHPNATRHISANLGESVTFSPGFRHNLTGPPEEPSPIDPSDPTAALEVLRELDHDLFLEAITKTGSVIRKWQKQCKEYRERAKGKISFRNFAKGDLALFLPTRNSVSKPWAAFNVSFPHYFLQATGRLAEQLKTREWIVARITSISERVVDQNDITSNPYGLGDGVKYYMLEVEDWTQPTNNKRRSSTRKVSVTDNESKELFPSGSINLSPSALPPGPPEAEVEDTYLVHPPNSHLFLVRPRSNSSPTARPSSLSRLLAQASPAPESQNENTSSTPPDLTPGSQNRSPSPPQSPTTFPPPPPSPSQHTESAPQSINTANNNIPSLPSPLRPGSRASRLSTTSKFSSRIPALGTVVTSQPKAAPTTALADQFITTSPTSAGNEGNPFRSPTMNIPDELTSEFPTSVQHRQRTISYQAPRSSPLAYSTSQATVTPSRPLISTPNTLVSLASNWGMTFARKKKAEVANASAEASSTDDLTRSESPRPDFPTSSHSARELLKRF